MGSISFEDAVIDTEFNREHSVTTSAGEADTSTGTDNDTDMAHEVEPDLH